MKKLIIDDIVAQKLTSPEITKKYGVSRQYVHQIAKSIGMKVFKRPPKKYEKKTGIVWEKRIQNPPKELGGEWKKYMCHRANARRRGIEFNLSFDEWWEIWKPYKGRSGVDKGKMCMCRNGDSGAYEAGNVRIDLVENNHIEYQLLKRKQKSI